MNFWFRKKYNLAPNDPRFLELTREDIETEYWAHFYSENKVTEEFDDEDFDEDAYLAQLEAEAKDRAAGQPSADTPPDVDDWVDID